MKQDREFDVVVFGASGFTGRLVAEYLAERYGVGGDVRWAMAGRSQQKLEAVRDEIGAPATTPLVVADSDDDASLRALAERTQCVVTTVGPYTWYGEPLLAACVETGTDYTDLCGEVLWMREMIGRYHARAVETGARIVHSTGFDSIPFDHGVLFLQQAAKERFGSPCQRVRTRVVDMRGTLSGGTAASGKATMDAVQEDPQPDSAALLNPFSLAGGFQGPEQPERQRGGGGADHRRLGGAVLHGADQHQEHPPLERTDGSPLRRGLPVRRDVLRRPRRCWAPGSRGDGRDGQRHGGEGGPEAGRRPVSKEERDAGGYELLLIGSHVDGGEIRARVTGDKDPGYGSTSKIMAEAALCLIEDRKDTPGGLWTPAAALGEALIPRLVERAGMTFELV